jgi:hypothetical protein
MSKINTKIDKRDKYYTYTKMQEMFNDINLSKCEYREAMRIIFSKYIASPIWKIFVELVKERDDYTCQDCGKRNCKLIVHHENYRFWGRADRNEANDCITLCQSCHLRRHKNKDVEIPFWAKRNAIDELTAIEESELTHCFKDINI